jgi:hypothetical protein
LKLSDVDIENLTGRSFRIIIDNGKDGILQSKLWKDLDLTSRDGSRVAIRLEKRSLIRRQKIIENGRWTYKLFATKLPVDTRSIEQAPCLTCPVEHMCSVDASYSPNNCSLIEDWALISFDSLYQQKQLRVSQLNEQQLLQIKAKENQLVNRETKSIAKHQSKRLTKSNKR